MTGASALSPEGKAGGALIHVPLSLCDPKGPHKLQHTVDPILVVPKLPVQLLVIQN